MNNWQQFLVWMSGLGGGFIHSMCYWAYKHKVHENTMELARAKAGLAVRDRDGNGNGGESQIIHKVI